MYLKKLLVVMVVIMGLTAVGLSQAGPASAEANRQATPIIAGTRIRMQSGAQCTVGVVLKSTSPTQRLIPKAAATRYIVIANHCVSRNGEGVVVNGKVVGQVISRSGTDDIALAKIDPDPVRTNRCNVGSFGVPLCTSGFRWEPQAHGRVVIASLRTRDDEAVPMPGWGAPGVNETFCTSGSFSGVNCSFAYAPVPESWFPTGISDAAKSDVLNPITGGDSGGPVMSANGKFYGIISLSGMLSATHETQSLMGYVRAEKVFQDFPGYNIAPPN